MKKYFLFLTLISVSLFAIDLTLASDKNTAASSAEIDQMISLFNKKRMKIEKEDAKKALLDNRILANALIDEKIALPEYILVDIKLAVEESLAELYVKNHQEKMVINDNVIKSYYQTNLKEFAKGKMIDFDAYAFKSTEDALNFYMQAKGDLSKIDTHSSENNNTKTSRIQEFKTLNPAIQSSLLDLQQTNYLTMPIKITSSVYVIHIKNITDGGHYTLQESKERIKSILRESIYAETRNKLLQKLKEEKQ